MHPICTARSKRGGSQVCYKRPGQKSQEEAESEEAGHRTQLAPTPQFRVQQEQVLLEWRLLARLSRPGHLSGGSLWQTGRGRGGEGGWFA